MMMGTVRPETSYELECLIINGFVGILRNCNGSVVL